MIIHWQTKNAGPTGQAITFSFNTFVSAPFIISPVPDGGGFPNIWMFIDG